MEGSDFSYRCKTYRIDAEGVEMEVILAYSEDAGKHVWQPIDESGEPIDDETDDTEYSYIHKTVDAHVITKRMRTFAWLNEGDFLTFLIRTPIPLEADILFTGGEMDYKFDFVLINTASAEDSAEPID